MGPRVLIAEDEALLREQVRELLTAAWPEAEIVAQAADGAEALHALASCRPDVLFLDIEMPEASGLEVARQANGRCHVVFVTAYDQFAVAAFEHGAVDYVMKPLSGRRMAMSVERLKERMRNAPARLDGLLGGMERTPARAGQYLRWINASRGKGVQLIVTDEVRFFQSDSKYTRVVAAKREGLIRKTIKELVGELDPLSFWQIHRSTIVNLHAVEHVGRDFRGNVVLQLRDRPEQLLVSQPFVHLFRQM
jgi:DNA-binding LytR/AlgR family response regulator